MLVDDAERLLNYQFQDPRLLTEAVTHASSADHRLESNERLEFLGDAVLGFVICEYLFTAYPRLLEGDLTKIKSAVVSRNVCAKISQKLDLCSLLDLGKGMAVHATLPGSVAAAVFESIIAAVYLDSDMATAKAFILEHLRPFIDEAAECTHQRNFKSVLQQYAQKHLPMPPVYMILDEKGPDHSKAFEICVEIDGRRFASAWANSKKEAEQQAACNALSELNVLADDGHGQITVHEPE